MSSVVQVGERISDTLLRFDGAAALIHDGVHLGYPELRGRVRERVEQLDIDGRGIVVLSGTRSVDWVVTYLALLEAGHVPLLAGNHDQALIDRWSPAAAITIHGDDLTIARGARPSADDLHPELALLLSTSGSTGAPKLVRLSHRNLISNAGSIANYLGLTAEDRSITSLPLHYCYGLSVLHSHLAVGAGVVLADTSVVAPAFRDAVARDRVTNIAGVPHTFELLERGCWDVVAEPSIRFLTQAGGRLDAARVVDWSRRAADHGVDFYVMYGQTEATARMAYLPPAMASRRPDCIGRAIPDGELTLRSLTDPDAEPGPDEIGELVYRGPNVMLGYAETPDDLSLGATIDHLATGDLARFHPDAGVFEIVGRRSRFVKPFGLRLDLDHIERSLCAVAEVAVAGDDTQLLVLAPGADAQVVRDRTAVLTGLPARWIRVATRQPVPRTSTGKVDHAAVARLVVAEARAEHAADVAHGATPVADVVAAVLGRHDVRSEDTFIALGGDSLRYVDCSVRLERIMGALPADWHLLPLAELEERASSRRTVTARWWQGRVDTTVALRALAICLVVSTHMGLWYFPGGAHLMLALVGFNISRFLLPIESTRERVAGIARMATRAAGPALGWMAVGALVFGAYSTGSLLLINNYVGPASHSDDHWHFWFIEVVIHISAVTALLFAIPALRRADRRHPYLVPLVALAVLLTLRLEWAQLDDWNNLRFRTHGVAWLAALGWLAHRSDTPTRRFLTSAVCLVVVPGFFRNSAREWFIVAALVLLLWVRDLPLPRVVIGPIGTVASASLWIYVSHFTVWPLMTDAIGDDRVAYVLTITTGVVIALAANHMVRSIPSALQAAIRSTTVERRGAVRTRPHITVR